MYLLRVLKKVFYICIVIRGAFRISGLSKLYRNKLFSLRKYSPSSKYATAQPGKYTIVSRFSIKQHRF